MEPTGLAPANVKAKAADLTIAINHGKFMTLYANHVVIDGEPEARRGANALCGISFGSTGTKERLAYPLRTMTDVFVRQAHPLP